MAPGRSRNFGGLSDHVGLAVRIAIVGVMATVIFVSALVLTMRVWEDFDLAIVGRDAVMWTDSETAPTGAVMLSHDGEDWMKDYIPLLGYVWWFGPLGFVLFLAVGLAIVYISRRPRLPGSYLTPTAAAVGVAIALFGVAAAPTFVCVTYDWAVPVDGCHSQTWFQFVPLLLGFLLLGFAALVPRSLLLGTAAGGLLGLFIGAIALFPLANAYGLWWLPLMMAVVGAVAGLTLSAAARWWRPDDRPTRRLQWVFFAAIVLMAFLPFGLLVAANTRVGAMVMEALGIVSSPSPPPACDLRPRDEPNPPADMECGEMVMVNGRSYFYGIGGWLDEDALRLEEVGPVTYPNVVGMDPMAYRLAEISPDRILVLRNLPTSQASSSYSVLWGRGRSTDFCRYADLYDHSRPGICRRSHWAAQGYVDHLEQQSGLLDRPLRQMREGEVSGDLAALATSAKTLESLAQAEVDWLDSHPPLDCYTQLHTSTRDAYALYAIVGAEIREAADAGDAKAAKAAGAELTAASNALDLAITAVPDMIEACGL